MTSYSVMILTGIKLIPIFGQSIELGFLRLHNKENNDGFIKLKMLNPMKK